MSQRTINVELTVYGETDVLNFHLDDKNPEKYIVNLNSSTSQNDLKNVFCALLNLLTEEEITLKLVIVDGYKKGLYKDVCCEYINDLNKEISQVKEEINQTLK